MSNQQENQKKQESKRRKNANIALRYSGMAFQMAVIMIAGIYLGKYLDRYFENETSILTALCALLSVGVALYLTLKDVK